MFTEYVHDDDARCVLHARRDHTAKEQSLLVAYVNAKERPGGLFRLRYITFVRVGYSACVYMIVAQT